MDETFDVGPDDKYQFKKYANDKDELAWEWWSWYGDREGLEETHPNNWVFRLASEAYRPNQITYYGQASTDSDKGKATIDNHRAPLAEYTPCQRQRAAAGEVPCRPHAVAARRGAVVPDESDARTTAPMRWPCIRTRCGIGGTRTSCRRPRASRCARGPTTCA